MFREAGGQSKRNRFAPASVFDFHDQFGKPKTPMRQNRDLSKIYG